MLPGLILASLAVMAAPTALFGRKSRSGWLEELDGIREASLDAPEGGVGAVADPDDIWTDLREGGEYEDPHEISSLYATDDTPDLPSKAKKHHKAPKPQSRSLLGGRSRSDEATEPDAMPGPSPEPAPVADPSATVVADELPSAASEDEIWTPAPPTESEPLWVQPAPHPVNRTEMWHPADDGPAPLVEASVEGSASEPVSAAAAPADDEAASYDALRRQFVDPVPFHGDEPEPAGATADLEIATAPAELDGTSGEDDAVREPATATAAEVADPLEEVFDPTPLESELVSAATTAVLEPPAPTMGAEDVPLLSGPVARKVRRDRPGAERRRNVLPTAVVSGDALGGGPSDTGDHGLPPIGDRGDRSPLPEVPLPPAALPPRAEPATTPTEPAPISTALAVRADGLVDVPGTILRLGGVREGAATAEPDNVAVVLDDGWCWVSPGDGAPVPVRVDLPAARFFVAPGATALAVLEADGSSFVIVADGSTELEHPAGREELGRGAVVMIDAAGAIQSDQASDDEIAGDPIVAENLALDAEL